MNILLDFFFPITSINPTPEASTAFLKQVCVVVAPADGQDPNVLVECTTNAQIADVTDNVEAQQLLAAGLSKVILLPVAGLDDIADAIEGHESDFFTILISSDFNDSAVTNDLDEGGFKGVVGVSSTDDAFLAIQAAIENRAAFHTTSDNKAKNMMYAFGKLLSNASDWKNQQYVSMPLADDVATLGDAESLFDDKISFVINDSEFGKRLSLFACGGKAIVAPYIKRNLEIDMQSKALQYVSGNQPGYTKTQAALLEDELDKVMKSYIARQWIDAGVVNVSLEQSNFIANCSIDIAEPKAMWRIFGEITQTL